MCGIVGFLRTPHASAAEADAQLASQMLSAIASRGPDGRGIEVSDDVAFGQVRLAIIDLKGGQQPRIDRSSGDMLVFNGEIYGYRSLAAELAADGARLLDQSDTEVLFHLLQRHGVAGALERIDGMFAFAYFDGRRKKLYLARDRFGEKPLYYAETRTGFAFGSEPRAVLRHPGCRDFPVDAGAIAEFLHFEYLPGTRSLRAGLRKLPAGHYAVVAPGKPLQTHRYWMADPSPAPIQGAGPNEQARIDTLEALLDESVRERLVADVPVGLFLSGGIDSSLLAAIAAKHAPGLHAFTIAMPAASYDEAAAAAFLSKSLGLKHKIVDFDDAALDDAFSSVASRMDEPMADASLLATWVVCRAARQHVTVALGGDGADELFAGYLSFRANRAAALLAQVPQIFGRGLRQALSLLPASERYMGPGFLLRQISQGFGIEPARQWAACMAPFASEDLAKLWRPEARERAYAACEDALGNSISLRSTKSWSTNELSFHFIAHYLAEDILPKVDRASMYNSLEVRAPYLGRAFADYALHLPIDDKLRGLTTKRLLKKLALRHLPRETVERKKHGFAVPLGALLRGRLRERVGDMLLGANSPLDEWFDRTHIEKLWQSHQNGSADHRKPIWTLFCLAASINNTEPMRLDRSN